MATHRVWGLTGNIGAGKSTVGAMLRERGARVIDSDATVRMLLESDEAVMRDVRAAFPAARRPDGGIDRAAVAREVFADRAKLTLLQDLLSVPSATTAGRATSGLTATMARLDLDPQVYLQRPREGEKPLLIPDFLPFAHDEGPDEIDLGGRATLTFKKRQQKLQSVSPAQWIAANARIMAALQEKGKLPGTEELKDYMSYTAKIGELACRYTWASVLAYDNEYRTQQTANSFRWGCDTQHLATVTLREKLQGTTGGRRQGDNSGMGTNRQDNTGRRTGPGGKEICLLYNRGRCSYGPRCNFEHVCLLCAKGHAQVDHRDRAAQDGSKTEA